MVSRNANKHVLGVIAASAMLAALFFARDQDWQGSHDPLPFVGQADAVAAGRSMSAAARALVSSSGDTSDAAARSRAVTIGMPPSMRQDFESTTDLYGYVQRLEPAVRAGNADAIWMVSRAYDYCAGFAMAPLGYARDTEAIAAMGLGSSQAMAASRQRVSQRCARFAPQDRLLQATLLRRTEAARAGSLAAEASLAASGRPLSDDDNYLRALVLRVRRSKDPEAYLALSPAMGIAASGKPELADQVAGTQHTELAWQVAACDLGLDCSPDSALMTTYCANGGICSREQGQDFKRFVQDAAVPNERADVVDEMVASLLGGG